MPCGLFSPEISEAFTVAPDVVYSPTVPVPALVTNRSEPDTAMPAGAFNEISEAFTVAPEVVYSPIVPARFATNRSEPDTAMADGEFNPEISEVFTVAPDVVYAPTVLAIWFVTKISSACATLLESTVSRTANKLHNPRRYNGFIVPLSIDRHSQESPPVQIRTSVLAQTHNYT